MFYPRGTYHNHSTMTFKILTVLTCFMNPALLFVFQFYSYLHTVDNMKFIAFFRIQFLHIVNCSAFLVECIMCAVLATYYLEVNEPCLLHRMYSRKIQRPGGSLCCTFEESNALNSVLGPFSLFI